MKTPALILAILTELMAIGGLHAAATATTVTVVERPDPAGRYDHYVANRPPLSPSYAVKLPVGAVRPTGWLRRQLELQAEGFHGRLSEISPFLKKENNAWLSPTGTGDHGWEEPPYWLKGYLGCALLLENERMLKESRIWIEAALNSQQPDGWFGPDKGRTGLATDLTGRDDLWPNMIMLFCLQTHYERTQDPRVLDLMKKYFRYLAALPEDKFLIGYWPSMRGGDQLYSLLWLYNRTGEAWLLDLAHRTHRHTARWDAASEVPGQQLPNWHNVNIAQAFREPTFYGLLSHEAAHRAGADRNWRTIRSLYGQVPGGMFGADENARPGYTGPRQAIETCGIAEAMLSDGLLLAATGDPVWAERCEDAAFNSYPASQTADLKALRYLTAPNMPQSDHGNKAPGVQNGGPMFHFNPHDHRCCQHNAGHAWPYFVQHLWYAAPGNGLAAFMYGPCVVTATVGDGVEARITEHTRYPFEERVEWAVALPRAVRFPLYLRVPAWCAEAQLVLNGQPTPTRPVAGKLLRIDREWKDGDRVVLSLPMKTAVQTWPGNRGTVSIDRGPLTYSLAIDEDVRRAGGTDAWPAWDYFPGSPWNFGLVLEQGGLKGLRVSPGTWPGDDQPFRAGAAPLQLEVLARRIPNWTLDPRGCIEEVIQSPVRSDEPEQWVRLIPMGAARLRLSAFPVIGSGPDARDWPPSPKPAEQGSASHGNDSDTVDALSDGVLPQSSGDSSIPRFTWWDHRGTREWVQFDFAKPRRVAAVEVYWFDDTGHGQCRVPQSWQVQWREGERWLPVTGASAAGTAIDRFNRVTFTPVTAAGVRLEVQLQPEFSGGILEWKVTE